MEIIYKNIDDLKTYGQNPRVISDQAVEPVASSIEEFWVKVPIIVDRNNVMVARHTRREAAEKLGMDEVAVIIGDDLSEEEVKGFRFADNKVAEFSDWDIGMLEEEISDLISDDNEMEQF